MNSLFLAISPNLPLTAHNPFLTALVLFVACSICCAKSIMMKKWVVENLVKYRQANARDMTVLVNKEGEVLKIIDIHPWK